MSKQLISTGTAAPTSTPTFEGQVYVDTTNDNSYTAIGIASSADWVLTSGGAPAWTTATLTINDGGTLTYSTTYNRYIITSTTLYWNFAMKQTNAGSGTTDITIDPPGGVTMVDGQFGPCTTFDMSNSNQMEGTAVEVVSNKLKVYNPALLIYLRGGAFVGNNGVCGLTCSLVLEIS